MHLEDAVATAIVLSREVRALEEQILEAAAKVHDRTGEDRVEIESVAGAATVSFPPGRAVIVGDPLTLRVVLPESQWSRLFVSRLVLGPEARDVLGHIKGMTRRAVDKVVALEPSKPTVVLAK